LVLGLQEWPTVGSERERVFRDACSARGLAVLAPGEDVALAYSVSSEASSADGITSREVRDSENWLPLNLTARGGWAGAAAAPVEGELPKNPIGPIVDAKAVMREAVEEFKAKLPSVALPSKDEVGLLRTTAAKTLVVLLAPPPVVHEPMDATSSVLVCVVIHAKEPKSAAAVAVLASFASKLVKAAQDAAGRLTRAEVPEDDPGQSAPPAWVVDRLTGADLSNFVVMSDTNIGNTSLNKS
jgi:hypothetical protein